LLREAVRLRIDEIKPGMDLVLIARQPIARVSFSEVSAAVEQVLRRAGLLESRAL
jgi:ribonuclease P protein component